MGGGTTRVGDPSGKDETRAIRSVEEIDRNKDSIKGVFAKVLRFGDGAADALMIDNAEWLPKLYWIDMLRDVGRHFSVNRMLAMDSVKLRLEREHEMNFIEFNYMICQAYDFTELNRRLGCNLQMGGSDQWGNIIQGVELGRRMGLKEPLHALTMPLLTTASGAKMGKTAVGAVWLNEEQIQPVRFLANWRNTEDADVERFLKLFSAAAARRNRKASGFEGRRDQRREESARDRDDGTAARPHQGRRRRRKARSRPSNRAASRRHCQADRNSAQRHRQRTRRSRPRSSPPASSSRTARRAARSRAAACASTIRRSPTRRPS